MHVTIEIHLICQSQQTKQISDFPSFYSKGYNDNTLNEIKFHDMIS